MNLHQLIVCSVCASLLAIGGRGCKQSPSAAGNRVLKIYSWSEYLPREVLDQFTAKTGIKVELRQYDSNEKLVGQLQAGVSDFDLVVPSDYTVALLKRQKLIQKIDPSRIPNLKNIDPRFAGRAYDLKNEYSIPFFWGTTGIGYNKAAAGTIDSWRALFDGKHAGKILMLHDARECLAAALKLMGKSLNEKDPAVLKRAGAMLLAQKKLVRVYDSDDFDKTLGRGDVILAQGFNGQFAKLMRDEPGKFAYVVPKEGATLWIDSLCIPAKAKHVAEAHEFLNFILDAGVGAELVNRVGYAGGNLAARAGVRKEILDDPAIYPPEDVLKRCEVMEDVGDDTMDLIDKIWQEITVHA